jgi:hypothetical protein
MVNDNTARIDFKAPIRYYKAVQQHKPPSKNASECEIKMIFNTGMLFFYYLFLAGLFEHARNYERREGESLPESDETIATETAYVSYIAIDYFSVDENACCLTNWTVVQHQSSLNPRM